MTRSTWSGMTMRLKVTRWVGWWRDLLLWRGEWHQPHRQCLQRGRVRRCLCQLHRRQEPSQSDEDQPRIGGGHGPTTSSSRWWQRWKIEGKSSKGKGTPPSSRQMNPPQTWFRKVPSWSSWQKSLSSLRSCRTSSQELPCIRWQKTQGRQCRRRWCSHGGGVRRVLPNSGPRLPDWLSCSRWWSSLSAWKAAKWLETTSSSLRC